MLFDIEESTVQNVPNVPPITLLQSVDETISDLSHLGILNMSLSHHAFLIPSIYSIAENKLLFYAISQRFGVNSAILQNSPDVLIMRSDDTAMKNTIFAEDMRSVVHFTYKTSLSLKNKIIIIDSIDSMRESSYNILLKSLEEPPENTFFFIVYHNQNAIPMTIKSRCVMVRENIYDVKLIPFLFGSANHELLNFVEGDLFLYSKVLASNFQKNLKTIIDTINNKRPLMLIDETSHNDATFYSMMFVLEWLFCAMVKVKSGVELTMDGLNITNLKTESIFAAHEKFMQLKKSIMELNTNRSLALFVILEILYA